MKNVFLAILFIGTTLSSATNAKAKYVADVVPAKMSVNQKKERFFYLLTPAVQKVYKELMAEYKSVANDIKNNKNSKKIKTLKKSYKVESDKELLSALKPHPPSITLSQAVIESAWATSRFFTEANNVFGMWSYNKNEPRIAAGETRGKKTIWLKKFDSIEESIRKYYKLMATGYAYKEFRDTRYKTDDPYKMIEKLDRYSELGQEYTKQLKSVIKYNKLQRYDKLN